MLELAKQIKGVINTPSYKPFADQTLAMVFTKPRWRLHSRPPRLLLFPASAYNSEHYLTDPFSAVLCCDSTRTRVSFESGFFRLGGVSSLTVPNR